ncbi:hypothetical protein Tco_1059283 [Tanacetum coccineum]
MSNTYTNLQTQTSNALYNVIMEAGGKDHPPMLAPVNYVQWKSRIKRYIKTKPNNEVIHYYLYNLPFKFKWTEKTVLVAEGSLETTTEGSQQAPTRNRGKAIVNSLPPTYDQEPTMVAEDNDNYNVFSNDREHPKQPESVNDIYLEEQGDTNITIDSLDMSTNGETVDQDDDLVRECDLLASLIDKIKCEFDNNKNHNKLLELSNKTLVDKLKVEIVADLRYFNFLENEIESLQSQLVTQRTQFLNEINRLSNECYYADHMNAILGVYANLDEFTDLQCNYVDQVVKYERLEKELSKGNTMSKSFEALQQYAIDLELALQQCQEQIKNDKAFKEN